METDFPPNAAQPKSRRRRCQFGLRTLLIGVTLAGSAFGWLGLKLREARQQKLAVAAIERLGGSVDYDSTVNEQSWFRELLGNDFFRTAVGVQLKDRQERLIVDANLVNLRTLKELRYLNLFGTHVTDSGLAHLATLGQLEMLNLQYTQVTDAGLRHLTSWPHLTQLTLDDDQVTDAGLENLQGLTELKDLSLSYTQLTDSGLHNLQRMTQLNELRLDGTHVTDAGLEQLKRLTQLKRLFVIATEVTEAGAANLRTELPACEIRR